MHRYCEQGVNAYTIPIFRESLRYLHMDGVFREQRIRESRKLLQNPYAYLSDDGGYDAAPLATGHAAREELQASRDRRSSVNVKVETGKSISVGKLTEQSSIIDPNSLLVGSKGEGFSRLEVERIVRALQRQLWRRRTESLSDRGSLDPIDILDPSEALAGIGYEVELAESLGEYRAGGQPSRVAGIVDGPARKVSLSRQFRPEVRRFTAAHELGHAVLHPGMGLHRDRPLDGASSGVSRERKEVEADWFASFFLMPEKQVRIEFERRFRTQRFVLDEISSFALNAGEPDRMRSAPRTTRELTRLLADARHYDGYHFQSLAERFRVSVEAMAIRLEELNLIRR